MISFQRLTAFFLTISMLCGSCSAAFAGTGHRTITEYKLGDVNTDGIVNTSDASFVLKYCAGIADFSDAQLKLGDLNRDGKVNTADATYILKACAGMLSMPEDTVAVDDGEEPTPTAEPTDEPTPTAEPTDEPTPTAEPTDEPTPTSEPTPTAEPTPTPEGDDSIVFDGDSIVTANDNCTVSGTEVTINAAGKYTVTGTLTDGRLIIAATKDDKVEITFTDVNITCTYDAPIYVSAADKVIITLEGDNSVTLSGTYADGSECKGAIHSNDDLTINGTGSLSVKSFTGNGIHCKDDLKINNCTLTVTANAGHGLRGNDSVTVKGSAIVEITASKDGIQTDNTEDEDKGFIEITCDELTVTAGGDALQADRLVTADGSVIALSAGAKGINSNGDFVFADGNLTITDSGEDAVNAQGTVTVSGGYIGIVKAGLDGIQADAGFSMTDGEIKISQTGVNMGTDDSGKGIKSATSLTFSGGKVDVTSYEDGLHSDAIITIDGGNINVRATAGDAIAADTDVVITGGTITLKTTNTDSSISTKGIKGTENLTVSNAMITADVIDDALHSNGTITIESGTFILTTKDDGIHADIQLNIKGGDITITNSYEGIESQEINISGGNTILTSSDDGINAADGSGSGGGWPGQPGGPGGGGQPGGGGNSNCIVNITGGFVSMNAGGDGLDSNGNVTMSDGILLISGPTNGGNGALDFDGSFTLTGGTVVACGSVGMVQYPRNTTVCTLNITFNSAQSANQLLVLTDNSGNPIVVYKPQKQYKSAVICSPYMTRGGTYKLYTGGTYSGGTETGGWYTGGTYSGGTLRKTVTTSTSSYITSLTV